MEKKIETLIEMIKINIAINKDRKLFLEKMNEYRNKWIENWSKDSYKKSFKVLEINHQQDIKTLNDRSSVIIGNLQTTHEIIQKYKNELVDLNYKEIIKFLLDKHKETNKEKLILLHDLFTARMTITDILEDHLGHEQYNKLINK